MPSIQHPNQEKMTLFRKSSALAMLIAYLLNGVLYPFYEDFPAPFDLLLSVLALQISFLLAIIIPAMSIFNKIEILSALKLRKLSKNSCVKISTTAIFAFPFVLIIAIFANELASKLGISFDDKISEFLKNQKTLDLGLFIFAGIFAAPIIEELAFRLCFFEFVKRFFKGSTTFLPVLMTSLVFSVLHCDPARMPALFLLGILLQYVMLRHKSILAPILFHAIHNILSFTVFFMFS